MSRRNRPAEPTLTVIWWRDIPAQVTARFGRDSAKAELPGSFQTAIDRAAMAAGVGDTDAYLEQWRQESRPCGPDLEAEVAAEVTRLEAETTPLLKALSAGGGFREDDPVARETKQ